MYIATQSFTSAYGRQYFYGQGISWLRYQLLKRRDKRNFVKLIKFMRTQPEEMYREELQERDEESSKNLFPGRSMDVISVANAMFSPTQFPVGDTWTPDEDIMHFPRQQSSTQTDSILEENDYDDGVSIPSGWPDQAPIEVERVENTQQESPIDPSLYDSRDNSMDSDSTTSDSSYASDFSSGSDN